jgi:hypothetical protein
MRSAINSQGTSRKESFSIATGALKEPKPMILQGNLRMQKLNEQIINGLRAAEQLPSFLAKAKSDANIVNKMIGGIS